MISMKVSKPWERFNFDTGPLLPLQRHNYFLVSEQSSTMTVEHDGLVSVFQLREASEHGFADCVLVRV